MSHNHRTYVKFELILKQHESIEALHRRLPITYAFADSVGLLLKVSKTMVMTLMDIYRTKQEEHEFNNEQYYIKVQYHLSILTGYYSMLYIHRRYSYMKQLQTLKHLLSSINNFKMDLKRSNEELEAIPVKTNSSYSYLNVEEGHLEALKLIETEKTSSDSSKLSVTKVSETELDRPISNSSDIQFCDTILGEFDFEDHKYNTKNSINMDTSILSCKTWTTEFKDL